jgi:excisionase family DNA binding protein
MENTADLEMFEIAIRAASLVSEARNETPISIKQACTMTGYRQSSIYQLVHKREIPFHKVHGRKKLFFYESELLAWMKGQFKKEVAQ